MCFKGLVPSLWYYWEVVESSGGDTVTRNEVIGTCVAGADTDTGPFPFSLFAPQLTWVSNPTPHLMSASWCTVLPQNQSRGKWLWTETSETMIPSLFKLLILFILSHPCKPPTTLYCCHTDTQQPWPCLDGMPHVIPSLVWAMFWWGRWTCLRSLMIAHDNCVPGAPSPAYSRFPRVSSPQQLVLLLWGALGLL